MKLSLLPALLASCSLALPLLAADFSIPTGTPVATPKPLPTDKELLHHMMHPFEKKVDPHAPKPVWHDLTLTMALDPFPMRVTLVRQLKVTVTLGNSSNKFVQLEFPTTQRIEVVIRDSAGKMIEQWSEDQAFTDTPGVISINPGEHLTYSASVSIREMAAYKTYIVEAFFPAYDKLRVQRSIVPGY